MNRNLLISIISLLFIPFVAIAQKGQIIGKVFDEKLGETLIGATVIIENTTTGATTDFDGNFVFPKLDAGTYNLICQFISYTPEKRTVTVKANETLQLEFKLKEASVDINEVVVVKKKNRESENLLMMEQKTSAIAVENIGAKELARKGASNVASGVKKVTGVSMMGSKQLFVRGLGDRYNAIQLNGLPLLSPDPQKKIVKLDIFPSEIIKVLEVNKAYSASNYADYTGALINIETKSLASDAFLTIKYGNKYNSISSFNDFKRIDSKGNNYFHFDVKNRLDLTNSKYKEVNKLMKIGEDFNPKSFAFKEQKAMPDLSFGFSGGRQFELKGKELSFVLSANFENEYEIKKDVTDISTNRQNNQKSRFVNNEYNYNSLITSLLSTSLKLNKKSSLKYHMLFINNGVDGFKEKNGQVDDWPDAKESLARINQYTNYRLFNNQFEGKHKLGTQDRLKLNWRASLTTSSYTVPDRQVTIYQNKENTGWTYLVLNNGNDTKRIVVEQGLNAYNYSLNLTYDLANEKGKLNFGNESYLKTMEYKSYFFGYEFDLNALDNVNMDINSPNDYLGNQYVTKIKSNTSDDMGYKGRQFVNATYLDLIYNLSDNLTANVGLRAELSEFKTTSNTLKTDGDEEDNSKKDFDLFPALNLKYKLNDKTNLRLALSRTLTRPNFFEKTPARLIPEPGEYATFGEPDYKDDVNDGDPYLQNSYSNNIEIKYEWFPGGGELVSLAAYAKQIINPIENVSRLMGGTDLIYTYQNLQDNAMAAGAELEVKKKLGRFFTGLNAAYIYTNVKASKNSNENESERPLQGASPYLINADFGYNTVFGEEKKNNLYFGLIYNVFGKRLYRVGVAGSGSQYEEAFHSLDFIAKTKFNKKLSISFSVKNLLNSKVQFTQEVYENLNNPSVKTNDFTIKEYEKGVSVGFSLAYTL